MGVIDTGAENCTLITAAAPLCKMLSKLASCRAAFDENHFLFMILPPSPLAAKAAMQY